ncbi:MAG: hydrogenase subunit MbhD domain-containing protein [Rickettsiales bacterium]
MIFIIFLIFLTLLIQYAKIEMLFFILAIYSLIIVLLYLYFNAFDLAITEAALGVFISSSFMLKFIKIDNKILYLNCFSNIYKKNYYIKNIYLFIFNNLNIIIFAILLFYLDIDNKLIFDMEISNINTSKLNLYYLNNTIKDINIKSEVAAILANYRGFDTLIETLVIFIAGIATIFLKQNNHFNK